MVIYKYGEELHSSMFILLPTNANFSQTKVYYITFTPRFRHIRRVWCSDYPQACNLKGEAKLFVQCSRKMSNVPQHLVNRKLLIHFKWFHTYRKKDICHERMLKKSRRWTGNDYPPNSCHFLTVTARLPTILSTWNYRVQEWAVLSCITILWNKPFASHFCQVVGEISRLRLIDTACTHTKKSSKSKERDGGRETGLLFNLPPLQGLLHFTMKWRRDLWHELLLKSVPGCPQACTATYAHQTTETHRQLHKSGLTWLFSWRTVFTLFQNCKGGNVHRGEDRDKQGLLDCSIWCGVTENSSWKGHTQCLEIKTVGSHFEANAT